MGRLPALAALVVVSQAASAAMTLDDLSIGKTVHGPNLTVKEMKGKVVLVEYWGTHCGPCLAMIPHLAKLYKKYEPEGFHIVGMESQMSSASEISTLAKSKDVEYQMTAGGQLKGATVDGIPHTFLFGPDGKLFAENLHGPQLEKAVKELVKDTVAAMAGPGPYKKLAAQAAQIKVGTGLATVLKTLTQKKASKDAEEAAEATMMYTALSGAAASQLEKAVAAKDEDPVTALARLDKLALQFAGDDVAKNAKTEADAMRKSPKVQKEIQAETMYKQLAAIEAKLKPFQGLKDPQAEGFRKVNAETLAIMASGSQALAQRYPETLAAKKAEELVAQYK